MRKKVTKSLVLPLFLLTSCAGYAAQPIDLEKQPISKLKAFIAQPQLNSGKRSAALGASANRNQDDLKEVKRSVDLNGTTHIRMQQTHDGYPVWGADAVVHVRKPQLSKRSLSSLAAAPEASATDMTGQVYQNLQDDLKNTPAIAFTKEQADKALAEAEKLAKRDYAKSQPAEKNSELMVYVDENNQAHWAFLTTLYFPHSAKNTIPAKPSFILDAATLEVYKEWNDVKAENVDDHNQPKPLDEGKLVAADGGGHGGNPTSGKFNYDGLPEDLAKLDIERDPASERCYLANSLAEVRSMKSWNEAVVSFSCQYANDKHNHVYWDDRLDEVNGGYSPANDALYAGSVIKSLYKDWYNYEMLIDSHNKPMKLKLMVHTPDVDGSGLENAFWDSGSQSIFLGDGADYFYPLTSLGVIAHEVSHGFTEQHSDLVYAGQSGALNESFSDMAAMAAESFSYGKNTWMIGSEIVKAKGQALRYLDMPSKDCESGHIPGQDCSIDTVDEYPDLIKYSKFIPPGDRRNGYVVHLASGVYNRMFYLLATSKDWTARKAFEVMVQANANYWTRSVTFNKAACGVLKATKDLGYDTDAPLAAFKTVGVDTSAC